MNNLFANLPAHAEEELVEPLVAGAQCRIERIVSTGQASPQGFWYDQDEIEWVLLLRGEAELLFEDQKEAVRLQAGDYLTIPPHCRHRVEWTTPDGPTIWLAVFYCD